VITITEKEKQYLASIDIKLFIDSIYSKSIFYELLQVDNILKRDLQSYNCITVIGLYNFVLNIIYSNLEEALNLKHILHNKSNKNKLKVCFLNSNRPYIRFGINNKTKSLWSNNMELEYIVYIKNTRLVLEDKLFISRPTYNKDHYFTIYPNNLNEFISKMLMLYNDFVDNIPI
jgi:hypothetical protein